MNIFPNTTDITTITTVITIFLVLEYCGCIQTNGRMNGPTHKNPTKINPGEWNQAVFCLAGGVGSRPSKNSPQCLHLIASS